MKKKKLGITKEEEISGIKSDSTVFFFTITEQLVKTHSSSDTRAEEGSTLNHIPRKSQFRDFIQTLLSLCFKF